MNAPIPARPLKTPAALLASDLAHPIALDLLMVGRYGAEWLDWDIEVLIRHLKDHFGVAAPDHCLNKLQACRTLHLVDTPWLQWEIFLHCAVALNGLYPDFRHMQAPTVAEAMLAVDCMNRIREDVGWSEEVKQYLSVLHRYDDVLVPQPPLDFVAVDTEGLPLDVPAIQAAWPEVRKTGVVVGKDPTTKEQLTRMLAAFHYLEEARAQLDSQLAILKVT